MKIKTSVSFVDEAGIPRWPNDVVEVSEEFAAALRESCEKFGFPVPEVIEEESAPKGKGGKANKEEL
nr:MAG TPA: SeqA protein N-terminal domain [Caudoviricetes sp.]